VQSLFIKETLRKAASATTASNARLVVCHSPDDGGAYFADVEAELAAQGPGDLGARMHRCLTEVLKTAGSAVLVGTDLPSLTASMLRTALDSLTGHDAVLGPTKDGGYYLIGFRTRPAAEIFTNMPWSTERVADITRTRMSALGLSWTETEPISDADSFEDLRALSTRRPSPLSPSTRSRLQELVGPASHGWGAPVVSPPET